MREGDGGAASHWGPEADCGCDGETGARAAAWGEQWVRGRNAHIQLASSI